MKVILYLNADKFSPSLSFAEFGKAGNFLGKLIFHIKHM